MVLRRACRPTCRRGAARLAGRRRCPACRPGGRSSRRLAWRRVLAAAFVAGAAVLFVVAAVVFVVAVFFAAAGFGLVSFGAGATPSTTSLNPFNGVILATVLALTLTASPVAGLRAIRAGRLTFENLANPVKATSSPLATVARITSSVPSMTFATTLGSTSVWAATAWASSRFLMDPPKRVEPGQSRRRAAPDRGCPLQAPCGRSGSDASAATRRWRAPARSATPSVLWHGVASERRV